MKTGSILTLDGTQSLDHPKDQVAAKSAFYQDEAWENVSQESLQTKGELSIMSRNKKEISSLLQDVIILFELGAGRVSILLSIRKAQR